MKYEPRIGVERRPRSYIVLDVESAVIDESGHRRYQATERYSPGNDNNQPARRGYRRSEDPLTCPRWVFQTIVTVSIMVLTEHADGNLEIAQFVTLSQPDHDERAIVVGLFQLLQTWPDAEIVTWAGMVHDIPLIMMAAYKHGLTLPRGWRWLSFGGNDPARHLDFARVVTGGFKMKPIHLAEVLAALDIPAKMTAPAFAVTGLIYAGEWDSVQEACECDTIGVALLLARWRRCHDGRADVDVATDRLLRRIIELREGRGYVAELQARRRRFLAEATRHMRAA